MSTHAHRYRLHSIYRDERLQKNIVKSVCDHPDCKHVVRGTLTMPRIAMQGIIESVRECL